jgi:hypothetical protein
MSDLASDLPPAAGDFRLPTFDAPKLAVPTYELAPSLANAVTSIRSIIETDKFLTVDARATCSTKEQFRALCIRLGTLLGELAVQNAEGAQVIDVYDRGIGRVQDGVRYHQTRQGGEIHTDSVNHPKAFRYLLLGCVARAILGGESIIVRASEVKSALNSVSNVLDTLRRPFWFEGRGMGVEVGFFQVPVLSDNDGVPRFRYLRSYIEAAHIKVGQPLTSEQLLAFDALDAALESSALQRRFTLECGHLLICSDTEVFHGRTAFLDGTRAGAWASQRHMLRLWVN